MGGVGGGCCCGQVGVCGVCRGVAVEGGFVGVVGGVWHFCGLLMGLCGWFWLPWWALMG